MEAKSLFGLNGASRRQNASPPGRAGARPAAYGLDSGLVKVMDRLSEKVSGSVSDTKNCYGNE